MILKIFNLICLIKRKSLHIRFPLHGGIFPVFITPPEISLQPVIGSLPEFSALPVLDTIVNYSKHPEFSLLPDFSTFPDISQLPGFNKLPGYSIGESRKLLSCFSSKTTKKIAIIFN